VTHPRQQLRSALRVARRRPQLIAELFRLHYDPHQEAARRLYRRTTTLLMELERPTSRNDARSAPGSRPEAPRREQTSRRVRGTGNHRTEATFPSPGKQTSLRTPSNQQERNSPIKEPSMASRLSRTTQDHDEIRRWADARHAIPCEVASTRRDGEAGILRLCFPNARNRNDSALKEIDWDQFFDKFDENGLSMVYQEKTASGSRSNFNKLIHADSESDSGSRSRSRSHSTSADSGSRSRSSRSHSTSEDSDSRSHSSGSRSTKDHAGSQSRSGGSSRSSASHSHSGRRSHAA
jgi:hypothetical protein